MDKGDTMRKTAKDAQIEIQAAYIARLEGEKFAAEHALAIARRRLEVARATIEIIVMGKRQEVGVYDR